MKEETALRLVEALENVAEHLADLRFGVSLARRTREKYDLSIAELRVCMCIVRGLTRQQTADELGIALNTVKNQLHKVLRKTGASTQRELVWTVKS